MPSFNKRVGEFSDAIKLPVAAILGAACSFAFTYLQARIEDKQPIAENPPYAQISRVTLVSPRFPRLSGERVLSQAELLKQSARTFIYIAKLNEKPILLTHPEVAGLVESAIKSGTLDRMESSTGELNLQVWAKNVAEALRKSVQFDAQKQHLHVLRAIITDETKELKNRRAAFQREILHTAYSRGVFNSVVGILTRNKRDEQVKSLLDDVLSTDISLEWPYTDNKEKVWYAFDLGTAVFLIDYDETASGHRAGMAKLVADVVGSQDPMLLEKLLTYAIAALTDEISTLDDFVEQSNRVAAAFVAPRLVLNSVLANQYTAPVTVKPIGAVRIIGINGEIASFPVTTTGLEFDLDDEESIEEASDEQYVTIKAGDLVSVDWSGEFPRNDAQWEHIESAYKNGTLRIEFVCETLSEKIVQAEAVTFGDRTREQDKEIVGRLLP